MDRVFTPLSSRGRAACLSETWKTLENILIDAAYASCTGDGQIFGGGVRVAGGGPTQRVFLRDLENSVYIRNITQCKVMVFPEGLCPEGNIITEGNISPNPPSGGSINNIL